MPSSPGLAPRASAAALLVALAASACARDGGVSDAELGELVLARQKRDQPIDVALAARDAAELGRALAAPHSQLAKKLGPHRLRVTSRTEVFEPGAPGRAAEELSDESILTYAADGAWHGVANNSADYGREVIYLEPQLYLRSRYQRWHQRLPNDEREPAALRDAFAEAGAATWDLLAVGAALKDGGETSLAGRAARVVEITAAASPRQPEKEPLEQRKWREGRTVREVAGSATLDSTTGAVLALSLHGVVGFVRAGRTFSMKISVDSAVSDLGGALPIAAPAAEEVVTTPGRLREVEDRDRLLEGIAPPLRAQGRRPRATTPTPQASPP